MTKNEEKKLAETARRAANLRETIVTTERMLRCWKKRRTSSDGRCYVSISSKDLSVTAAGYLSAAMTEKFLESTLREVNVQARIDLKRLALPKPHVSVRAAAALDKVE